MDSSPQGSLLPATLLSRLCELSCGDLGFGPLFLSQEGFGWSWFLREFSADRLFPKDKPPLYWSALSRGRRNPPGKCGTGILLDGVTACPRTVVGRTGVIWREEAAMETLLFRWWASHTPFLSHEEETLSLDGNS